MYGEGKISVTKRKESRYILVLWGKSFEEDTAIVFVVELRKLGNKTKLVGIDGSHASGIYGANISSDISLDQALGLAENTLGIVMPCSSASIKRMENDPRLHKLMHDVHMNNASIIVKDSVQQDIQSLRLLRPYMNSIEFYLDNKNIDGAVREVFGTNA